MQLHRQKIATGGTISYLGSLDAQDMIVFIGRENFLKDDHMIYPLIEQLHQNNHTVIWYEYLHMEASRLIATKLNAFFKRNKWIPLFLRRIIKTAILLPYPKHWQYILRKFFQDTESLEFRKKQFQEFIDSLPSDKNITVLSRSVSGRISSLLADAPAIKRLICMAYPFKNPERPIEPERYLHLEHIKKPFLIIQGTRDQYGGTDIQQKYKFSPQVSLSFIDTDHDFDLSAEQWKEVIAQIHDFIKS